jgi:hypothetical protein
MPMKIRYDMILALEKRLDILEMEIGVELPVSWFRKLDEWLKSLYMWTKTDIMDLIRVVCDFYNCYCEYLGMTHKEARSRVKHIYNDLQAWVYKGGGNDDKV